MRELLDIENNLPNELLETPNAGQQWADTWAIDQTDVNKTKFHITSLDHSFNIKLIFKVPGTSTSTDTSTSPVTPTTYSSTSPTSPHYTPPSPGTIYRPVTPSIPLSPVNYTRNITNPNEETPDQAAADGIAQHSLEQDDAHLGEPREVPNGRSTTVNDASSTRPVSDPVKQKFAQHHFLLTILHTLKCRPGESSAASSSSTGGEPQVLLIISPKFDFSLIL